MDNDGKNGRTLNNKNLMFSIENLAFNIIKGSDGDLKYGIIDNVITKKTGKK
jgi:hypothetical protein